MFANAAKERERIENAAREGGKMRMIIEIGGRGEIDVQVELMEGYFSPRPNKAYPAMRRRATFKCLEVCDKLKLFEDLIS